MRISTYNFVVLYLTVNTGQVNLDLDWRSNFSVVCQWSKQKHIGTFTAAVDAFRCDNVATEVSYMNGHVLFIYFKFILLNLLNRKYCFAIEISMPHSDVVLCCINVSDNVRYLDFVLCTSWEYPSDERLQMVFTDGSHQTILPRNVVTELVGISVNVSTKCRIHTGRYVQKGVGVIFLNSTGLPSDQSHDVKPCLKEICRLPEKKKIC